jgi:YfiH family protein
MAGWKRKAIGDMPVYQAVTMAGMPQVVQGFTTRRGGASLKPYDSLNLSLRVEDDPVTVQANRQRLWLELGFPDTEVAFAEQVHGDRVGHVTHGSSTPFPGVDALITDTPGVLLMMLFADCVPVYVLDPLRRVLGLAHAGWRGTASGLPGKVVSAMASQLGAVPLDCLAAIGPCISGDYYEVRSDVADQFRSFGSGPNSGASTAVIPKDEFTGKYLLNLRKVVFMQLLAAGLRADAIFVSDDDTYRNARDFYSFRRDGPESGRMAAFFGLRNDKKTP